MKLYVLAVPTALLLSSMTSCGTKQKSAPEQNMSQDAVANGSGEAGEFSQEWLSEFNLWTPVLAGDKAFQSSGHGGIWVHSYLNSTAAEHVRANPSPYPLPENSVLAKAVVSGPDADAKQGVTRVYFMKKEKAGFDPEHNDWSYALASKVDGQLTYQSSVGPRETLCVSCHAKFAEYDYVQTIDLFRKGQ